ncbi:MAG: hypothetical protein U0R52_06925 [Solirubrobacterales bacterium]
MKRLLGVVLFAACVLGAIQLAAADTKTKTDSRTDASPNSVDLVSASAGHRGKRKLRHTVKLDGPVDDSIANLQVILQMNVKGNGDCEFEIFWPPKGKSKLVRCGIGFTNKNAVVSQPSPKTLRFTFPKRLIGSPAKYGWRLVTRDEGAGGDILDSLPDEKHGNPVYVIHKLR